MDLVQSTMNQMGNATNPHQGDTKKVLCVCSAGLLRSPTLAHYLNTEYGYNTRAVGSSAAFALIPLSQALVHWADEIVFVDHECYIHVIHDVEFLTTIHTEVKLLDIPDNFAYDDPQLLDHIKQQYEVT